MKLIFCPECQDMFKLLINEERKCSCGACSGKYINNTYAEVSGPAISVAIGNGSLMKAIFSLESSPKYFDRDWYIKNCKVSFCWVRPNEGEGNPHTKIKEK